MCGELSLQLPIWQGVYRLHRMSQRASASNPARHGASTAQDTDSGHRASSPVGPLIGMIPVFRAAWRMASTVARSMAPAAG